MTISLSMQVAKRHASDPANRRYSFSSRGSGSASSSPRSSPLVLRRYQVAASPSRKAPIHLRTSSFSRSRAQRRRRHARTHARSLAPRRPDLQSESDDYSVSPFLDDDVEELFLDPEAAETRYIDAFGNSYTSHSASAIPAALRVLLPQLALEDVSGTPSYVEDEDDDDDTSDAWLMRAALRYQFMNSVHDA